MVNKIDNNIVRGFVTRFSKKLKQNCSGALLSGFILCPEFGSSNLGDLYSSIFILFLAVFGYIVFDEWKSLINTVLNRNKVSYRDFVHSAEGEKEKAPLTPEEELLKKKREELLGKKEGLLKEKEELLVEEELLKKKREELLGKKEGLLKEKEELLVEEELLKKKQKDFDRKEESLLKEIEDIEWLLSPDRTLMDALNSNYLYTVVLSSVIYATVLFFIWPWR